jgi:hypothetical protein
VTQSVELDAVVSAKEDPHVAEASDVGNIYEDAFDVFAFRYANDVLTLLWQWEQPLLPADYEEFLVEFDRPAFAPLKAQLWDVWRTVLPQRARDGFCKDYITYYFQHIWDEELEYSCLEYRINALILQERWSALPESERRQDAQSVRTALRICQVYELWRRFPFLYRKSTRI